MVCLHRSEESAMQITLRGVDPALARRIRQVAQEEGLSLSKAALRILRRGAGIAKEGPRQRIGHQLDAFFGTWNAQEARQLLESIESYEQVDDAFWASTPEAR
jgi:hypothetical protein